MDLFRIKSVERSIAETDEPETRLKKELSAWDLTVFGVGVMVGTGIFVLTGEQAYSNAGPAIVISFVIAGIVCAALILLQLLIGGSEQGVDLDRKIGVWLGTLAALGVAAGGFLKKSEPEAGVSNTPPTPF